MFSLWDQLFGTAVYTRKFPAKYGLVNDPKEHWADVYLYPLLKSEMTQSELNPQFKKTDSSTYAPIELELKADTNYLWCRCGKSRKQPFCDGSHHGTKFKPQLFQVKRSSNYRLCNCKASKASPFCDDSHLDLKTKN